MSDTVLVMVTIVIVAMVMVTMVMVTSDYGGFSVACADAYLTPCIQRYVINFISGFKNPVSM